MSKLKEAVCIYCGRKINRHDVNRVDVKVASNVTKSAHLSCSQRCSQQQPKRHKAGNRG